ncbi:hypothetical protein [Streptomyces rubrolavendulae]|nr:hypothetical protein [Streptomyces rubrolavendulae]
MSTSTPRSRRLATQSCTASRTAAGSSPAGMAIRSASPATEPVVTAARHTMAADASSMSHFPAMVSSTAVPSNVMA